MSKVRISTKCSSSTTLGELLVGDLFHTPEGSNIYMRLACRSDISGVPYTKMGQGVIYTYDGKMPVVRLDPNCVVELRNSHV